MKRNIQEQLFFNLTDVLKHQMQINYFKYSVQICWRPFSRRDHVSKTNSFVISLPQFPFCFKVGFVCFWQKALRSKLLMWNAHPWKSFATGSLETNIFTNHRQYKKKLFFSSSFIIQSCYTFDGQEFCHLRQYEEEREMTTHAALVRTKFGTPWDS